MTKNWTADFQAWQERARKVTDCANRTRDMIIQRAKAECAAAGLSSDLLGIHPHNAMCSYNAGKPWPGVDYAKVRRTLWLIRKAWEPGRKADAINARSFEALIAAHRS